GCPRRLRCAVPLPPPSQRPRRAAGPPRRSRGGPRGTPPRDETDDERPRTRRPRGQGAAAALTDAVDGFAYRPDPPTRFVHRGRCRLDWSLAPCVASSCERPQGRKAARVASSGGCTGSPLSPRSQFHNSPYPPSAQVSSAAAILTSPVFGLRDEFVNTFVISFHYHYSQFSSLCSNEVPCCPRRCKGPLPPFRRWPCCRQARRRLLTPMRPAMMRRPPRRPQSPSSASERSATKPPRPLPPHRRTHPSRPMMGRRRQRRAIPPHRRR